jgi:glycosyltransferase involved in cell wall biosynthesis
MWRAGGALSDWVEESQQVEMNLMRGGFRPDVLLATFGSMESLFVARQLSLRIGVPWILDLKDNWCLYVPFGLRHLMATRTSGWSAVTVNGGVTRACARRFQRSEPQLLYSGVDDCYLEPQPPPIGHDPAWFTINIIGGLYFEEPLADLLAGIERWATGLAPAGRRVRVHYFGSDGERFRAAASRHLNRVSHACHGYLDKDGLAAHCQWAACNVYVSHWGTFHHKLMELLACGRPILVNPPEREESRQLARDVAAPIIETDSADSVAQGLAIIYEDWRSDRAPSVNGACARFSWPAQTRILEKVLSDVLAAT